MTKVQRNLKYNTLEKFDLILFYTNVLKLTNVINYCLSFYKWSQCTPSKTLSLFAFTEMNPVQCTSVEEIDQAIKP